MPGHRFRERGRPGRGRAVTTLARFGSTRDNGHVADQLDVPVPVPVLVYDGDCGFCTWCAVWARTRVAGVRYQVRPWQDLDLAALGLTDAQCRESAWLIDQAGERRAGHRAVAAALLAGRGGWRWLGRVIMLPGFDSVAAVVYRWVAARRHRLPGGTPQCGLPTGPS